MVLSFMNMCDRWKFTKNEIVQKWYKSINTFSPDYKKMLKNAGDDTSTYLQQKDQQEDIETSFQVTFSIMGKMVSHTS